MAGNVICSSSNGDLLQKVDMNGHSEISGGWCQVESYTKVMSHGSGQTKILSKAESEKMLCLH